MEELPVKECERLPLWAFESLFVAFCCFAVLAVWVVPVGLRFFQLFFFGVFYFFASFPLTGSGEWQVGFVVFEN